MRLEMDKDMYKGEYMKGYPQTKTKGKVEVINKFIRIQHGGKEPILVAGDSGGMKICLPSIREQRYFS